MKQTKEATIQIQEKCTVNGVLDPVSRRITVKKEHNHPPDSALLQKLKLKRELLDGARNSTKNLSLVFKDVTRGKEGASLVGFPGMTR